MSARGIVIGIVIFVLCMGLGMIAQQTLAPRYGLQTAETIVLAIQIIGCSAIFIGILEKE